MAKHLNLDLTVRADTGQAKAQIQELQTILNKIMHTSSTTSLKGIDATKIQQAASAAKELQMHLNNAFNASTGKFDLSQLDKSLKASGSNITDLSTKLLGAGQSGQQAFMKLAQSISLADQPMLRINNKLNEFATTLKNTARWQLSSSMLHEFMGAVQSAYGYAQDLNKSLTDIRIVTGQNTEQMAKFAEEANKAAKNLSTTTTDYTNASLIYYQQGLDNDEVIERTNVTIKMANAAGESAQTVSDQMTAVWNNFAKGGENLEYYADVMTALGAATASSTSEISEGLNKFAAVAETVGLSYEYATAALATVTATTRQSADIVGTAFKTLFARIQDLKLGETLEDGTTLGKYSAALAAVGVDIKDTNDEIKEMDTILEEMAAKWDTLAKDRQVALAQSVAGVRQYTQLIALMDNWDFMQENLETARNAEGTLTEQAEIYAESWEAASKRVKASAQGLYQSLLDDDFFIDVNNGFATMLTGLDAFIDGAGGLKTVLLGISSIIVSNFANKIPQAISTAKYNIDVLTKGSTQAYQKIQADMQKATNQAFSQQGGINKNSSMGFMVDSSNQLAAARTKLATISDKMSASEKQLAETELNLMQQTQQETYTLLQKKEALENNVKLMETSTLSSTSMSFEEKSVENYLRLEKAIEAVNEHKLLPNAKIDMQEVEHASESLSKKLNDALVSELSKIKTGDSLNNIKLNVGEIGEEFNKLKNVISNVKIPNIDSKEQFTETRQSVVDLVNMFPKAITESKSLKNAVENIGKAKTVNELVERFEIFKKKLDECQLETSELGKSLKTMQTPKEVEEYLSYLKQIDELAKKAEEKVANFNKTSSSFQPTHIVRTSEAFGSLAGLAGNTATAINSLSSTFKNLTNPDLSGWEKMSSVLMAFSFTVPTVISAMKGLGTVTDWVAMKNLEFITTQNLSNTVSVTRLATLGEVRAAELLTMAAEAKRAGSTKAEIVALITKNLTEKDGIDDTLAAAMAEEVAQRIEQGRTTSLAMLIGMKLTDIATTKAQNFTIGKYNVLMIIANALTSKFGMLWLGLGIGAIIAGVASLVAFIDKLNITEEEANKTMSESISKWKEAKSELESLNSELETTKDRIAELEAMDSLSLVEQEELDKLLEQEASLERQLFLKQEIEKANKQQTAKDFEKNYNTLTNLEDYSTTRWVDVGEVEPTPIMVNGTIQEGSSTAKELSLEEYKKQYIDTLYDDEGNLKEGIDASLAQEREEYYQQWLEDEDAARAEWIARHQESLENAQAGYEAWLEQNQDASYEEKVKYARGIEENNRKAYGDEYEEKVYESSLMDSYRNQQSEERKSFNIDSYVNDLSQQVGDGLAIEDAANKLSLQFTETFKNQLLAQGIVPEDYATYLINQQLDFENEINDLLSRIRENTSKDGEEVFDLTLDKIKSDKRWKDEDLEILTKIKIDGNDDLNDIFDKIENYKENEIITNFNVGEWKTGFGKKLNIASGVEQGGTISEEDYATLGDAYSHFFEIQSDGTAKLIGKAEDLQAAIKGIETEELKEMLSLATKKVNEAESVKITDSEGNITTQNVDLNLAKTLQEKSNLGMLTQNDLDLINAYKESVAETFDEEITSLDQAISLVEQYNIKISESQEALFNSATSLQELKDLRNQMIEEYGEIDYTQYSEALMALASNYDNCTEEIEKYKIALQGADQDQITAAEDALNAATLIGEAAEKYDFDPEVLEVQAKQIQKLNGDMNLNAEQAAQIAINNQRMNKGIKTLNDNFKDWKKTFKNADKDSMDYADAIVDCTDAIADLVGASEDLELPSEFFENTENMKLIEKAMKGDVEAINKLGGAVAQCTVEALEFNGQMARLAAETWVENGLNVDIGLDIGQFEEDKNTVLSAIQGIRDGTLQAGSEMGDNWVAALNRMALATGMSVEEMNGLLGSMGVQAKVETKYVKQKTMVPTYTEVVEDQPITVRETTSDGRIETITKHGFKHYTIPGAPMEVEGYVPVAQISTTDNPLTPKVETTSSSTSSPAATYSGSSGRGSVSPSSKKSKGGGGGGNDKKTSDERKNKSDTVERYKEINDQLDITAKKMDDASEIADTLYGSARIKKMREVSKTLQQEINLLEQKNAEAKKYLSQDKTDLNSAASILGIGLSYGANGEITNIEDAQTKLFNQREALLDSFGDTINDSEQKLLEALDKKIETFEKALEQYEDTRELRDELDSEILNKKIEWQENNFDIWEESLELNLEVNDNSLSELERKLEDLEDDFYSMAEAAALMIGEVVDGFLDITGTQLENYTEMTTDLAEKKTELDQKYINGSITQADYIEGLKTLKSEVESNSDNIKNLDDAMIHYYGDTLQAAQEELSQYTDLMSQHTEILEHYVNIMDIIGESTDYKKMGVILEGQAKVAENTMKVSKANYEMLNKQREVRKAEYEAAMNSATDEELEILKQKWLDAETVANDAQDQMMADTEAWAESLKAVLENKLAGFAQELENTLTGEWGSFDQMTAAMDRASSLQEEYLTNTNKIYETNKLMNKAQQDLDKTTNSVAKKRLQAYIDETQQLQDQAELSNYELEIQQAKYDLLLAEIALEEAQAAKSTVRLQRDSEGNFGYVYTSDSSALAQAEQELEDAQNSLYNIGLKGANDYSQKYQQTLSEMYDSLKELQEQYLSGSFESEQEYNDAVVAAKEYYYEKLKQYSNLYQVALTTDSNVIADAWSSDFNDMIYSTENWQTAVDDYLTQVEGAFTQWEVQIQQIKDETVGPNLEALAEKVEDITTENKELTEQITGGDGLIDALKDEIEQVNNITNAYANQRAEVLALRDANNALITSINSVIAAQTNIDNNENSDNENISENNNNNNNQNSNNNNNQNNDTGDNIDFNKIKIGSEIEVESGSRWYNDSYGAGPTGSARSGTIKSINIKGSHPYNIEGLGWISKSDIKKINRYNTGGYTGDWGPEGKLGILDEKELVLNKNDTANFLASMEILDKILQAIDLQTLNSQIGGILSSPSFGNLETKTLEQQVTIEANFPGVSVASEIEEAFGNLVNLASQYANRK